MPAASQDDSYANRLRFTRGKIALKTLNRSSPQPLVTPGIQNPHSAYATIMDGRLVSGYAATSAGGVQLPVGDCCGCLPATVTLAGISGSSPTTIIYSITWSPAGNYTALASGLNVGAQQFEQTSPITGELTVTYTPDYPPYDPEIPATLITLISASDCAAGTTRVDPCFLAGSLVALADGSSRSIEEIRVGDVVIGAFGEHNEVLALHRPVLGSARMCRINDEHSTTSHHPHISVDRKFYCMHPATVEQTTYGHEHDVIDGTGQVVKRMLHGLAKGRVQELTTDIHLKTIDGCRLVEALELYELPPETQLYNLVVGGSHTYHVDGYAVTGWPSEDDFDYDAWAPKA